MLAQQSPKFFLWFHGILILSAVGIFSGCSRQFWREQGMMDAHSILIEKTQDPRWELKDYRFEAKKEARFFSPYDKDAPPMPEDDPSANWFMRCVYGKKGWDGWTRNGVVRNVENPDWTRYLPVDEQGNVILNRETTIRIALTNSPEYQSAMENLYLAALGVSLQRFSFDTQFAFGSSLNYSAQSTGNASLRYANSASASRNLAAGGQILTDVANSIVWNFGSSPSRITTSLVNMSLVQPLLRYGGRAYALENLTAAERGLLMNIRQMERYRQGFYVNTIAGSTGISAPGSGGSGIPSDPGGVSGAGSLYGLIYRGIRLTNQRNYVNDLRDSCLRMEAMNDADRIDRSQVDLTRQSLLSAQINLLSEESSYQSSLDNYKMSIGLPPAISVVVNDQMLKNFILILPDITELRLALSQYQIELRQNGNHQEIVTRLNDAFRKTLGICKILEEDFVRLEEAYPSRVQALRLLAAREEFRNGSVDFSTIDPSRLDTRMENAKRDYQEFLRQFKVSVESLKNMDRTGTQDAKTVWLNAWIDRFSSQLLELSLIQATVRLDAVTLVSIVADETRVMQTARENRLDWMNARAALVDQWRQIEIAANRLKSDVTVTVDGGVDAVSRSNGGTSTVSDINVGLRFAAPLTRRSERNSYISTLISYDRARRSYMNYEDAVHRNIRSILRDLELAQLNFELQRAAVLVAMSRVDQANLQLLRPPKPGETSKFGDSFSRDLVDALNSLMNSQNTFISAWIDYEARRMGMDIMLGTFRMNAEGVWIDPGPVQLGRVGDADAETETGTGGNTQVKAETETWRMSAFAKSLLGDEQARPSVESEMESLGGGGVSKPAGRSVLTAQRPGSMPRIEEWKTPIRTPAQEDDRLPDMEFDVPPPPAESPLDVAQNMLFPMVGEEVVEEILLPSVP